MLFQPFYFYIDQSNMPWFHSWITPKIKINKNKIKTPLLQISHEVFILTINGKINTNSTSKIKKIKVTMKNRIEKGIRDFKSGVNPHS